MAEKQLRSLVLPGSSDSYRFDAHWFDGHTVDEFATASALEQLQTTVTSLDAFIYKGTIAPGATLPAADCGHTYKASGAGTICGYTVEAGDLLVCNKDGTAAQTTSNASTIKANWDVIQTNVDMAALVEQFSSADHQHTLIASGTVGDKSITPKGTVTSTFTGTAHNHTASFTGTEATLDHDVTVTPTAFTATFSGSSLTSSGSYKPEGTIADITYTPTGSVSVTVKPEGTISKITHKPAGTITINDGVNTYTPVGTISDTSITPAGTVKVENATAGGTISKHKHVITPGTTTQSVVSSSGTASMKQTYVGSEASTDADKYKLTLTLENSADSKVTVIKTSAPTIDTETTLTFTGTAHTHTATFTGTAASHGHTFTGTEHTFIPTFAGTEFSVTPTFTGTSKAYAGTFTGTEATLETTFTGTSKSVSVSGTPAGTIAIKVGETNSNSYTPNVKIADHVYAPAGGVTVQDKIATGTIESTFTGTAEAHNHSFSGTSATTSEPID